MRKISKQAARAFLNGNYFQENNTLVHSNGDMFLFGNHIVRKNNNGIEVNFCGFDTNTTKERINALCSICGSDDRFYHKDYVLMYKGKSVTITEWIAI